MTEGGEEPWTQWNAGAATQSVRKVAAASFIGTTIEWYDFFLYGTAAALVFGELFFPEAEPLVGTLLAFSTYAVGFAARPIGGSCSGTSATASAASRCSCCRC